MTMIDAVIIASKLWGQIRPSLSPIGQGINAATRIGGLLFLVLSYQTLVRFFPHVQSGRGFCLRIMAATHLDPLNRHADGCLVS